MTTPSTVRLQPPKRRLAFEGFTVRRTQWILLVLFSVFLFVAGNIQLGLALDEPTPEDLKEFDALLAKTKREKPDEYRVWVALVQSMLGAFGYGTGPFDGVLDSKTVKAIRKYQHVRKLPVTGDLDAKTFVTLRADYDKSEGTEVKLLPPLRLHLDSWDEGWVKAYGTWRIIGEKDAYPVQTSEIYCDRQLRSCQVATADLAEFQMLRVHTETYSIDRWDEHEIVTKPRQLLCVRYTMRISRAAKSVTGVRLRTRESGPCEGLAPELQLKLADGEQAMEQAWETVRRKLEGIVQAPALTELLKKIRHRRP